MTTLRIENTVRDYASWQKVFDTFERFRADHGVRSYRICRQAGDPNQITVDLEFGSTTEAEGYVPLLAQIWSTPQSRDLLVDHAAPQVLEQLRHRVLEESPA